MMRLRIKLYTYWTPLFGSTLFLKISHRTSFSCFGFHTRQITRLPSLTTRNRIPTVIYFALPYLAPPCPVFTYLISFCPILPIQAYPKSPYLPKVYSHITSPYHKTPCVLYQLNESVWLPSLGTLILLSLGPSQLTEAIPLHQSKDQIWPRGTPEPPTYIIGGTPSEPCKWPWHVALLKADGSFLCGATLISNNWVLTAGHCLYGKP